MERYFRGEKFIDREENIKFFINWFEKIPKEILWVYGPKSSGKTTLIEYIVEKELIKDFGLFQKSNYWIKYINFRGILVTSYDSFIDSIIEEADDGEITEEQKRIYDLWIFKFEASKLKQIKEKKKNIFNVLIEYLEGIKKKKIIIIDEIQTLQEIYINGDRELLKEFLNFCVRLTKETHISHIVILSSNTIFIDKIYNDAKLKMTSHFYKVDHLEKSIVIDWLNGEGFNKEEIKVIWEYFGGCIPMIQKLLIEWDRKQLLEEYLEKKAFLAYTEIVDFLARGNTGEEEETFREIAKIIVEKERFVLKDNFPNKKQYIKVIDKWADKEIFFYDPKTLEVTANSRIYKKGMEKLIGNSAKFRA